MSEGDRVSRIPTGKEGKYLLLALALLAFWTYAAVADLLDGAIKMKGSSAEMTLSSNPFWFLFFAAFIVIFEIQIIRFTFVTTIAFFGRK